MNQTLAFLVFATTLGVVAGCHNSDTADELNTDYSQLKLAPVSSGSLVTVTDPTDFATLLKNGIRLQLSNRHGIQTLNMAEIASADYSNTNLHEAGVDEADRIAYDGDHLFVAGIYDYSGGDAGKRLRILATNPDQATAAKVAELSFGSETVPISGLYLRQNENQQTRELVALGSTFMYGPVNTFAAGGTVWESGETVVGLFDVVNPAAASRVWTLTLEGLLLESRRLGDQLYLVTHSFPVIMGLNYGATTDAEKLANERLIHQAELDTLLPHYRIDDGSKQPLVSANDCLAPSESHSDEGFANIVTLTVIDLVTRQIIDSTCLNTPVQGLYASVNHLYLGGSDFSAGPTTVLHQFKLSADAIDYQATGTVGGTLGWTDPGYRMNEHDDTLRLITSTRAEDNSLKHQLHVLADDGNGTLSTVASLPNAAHPEAIGKPGEDIYAVRFLGDRAYVVSFERIDPLYVIDLFDPNEPVIAGELEVPGVSAYLHPVGEDYLLSVGMIRNDGMIDSRVKVELFNVANMAAPYSAGSVTLGEHRSVSEANYDSRSLNFRMHDANTLRFTVPVQIYDTPPANGPYYEWTQSGLQLFEISNVAGSAHLSSPGQLVVDRRTAERQWPLASVAGRSRMHDDAVFHVYGNAVWSALWQTPDVVNGPQ